MKRWILAEMVMVAAIFFLGWVIKIQLNPVAQAKETTAAEIYVQTEKGLIPYSQVKIVPIGPVKAVLKKEPVVDQPVKTSNQQLLVQVYEQYALYQRYGTGEKYLRRLSKYNWVINQAALYLGLDPDLGRGLIAAESMGNPNAVSSENAIGLTQILNVPNVCQAKARRILGANKIDLYNPVHNIWLGLLTLRHYLQQRDNDLLLGLVSYNYGPNRPSVIQATSWEDLQANAEIKSYPIKVLALTLLAKVRDQYGQVLPYTKENRGKIEAITLPGIE